MNENESKWKLVGYLCPQCLALNKSVFTNCHTHEGKTFQAENRETLVCVNFSHSEITSIQFEDCNHITLSHKLYDVRVYFNSETNEVSCYFISKIPKEDKEKALNNIRKALNNPTLKWYKR